MVRVQRLFGGFWNISPHFLREGGTRILRCSLRARCQQRQWYVQCWFSVYVHLVLCSPRLSAVDEFHAFLREGGLSDSEGQTLNSRRNLDTTFTSPWRSDTSLLFFVEESEFVLVFLSFLVAVMFR